MVNPNELMLYRIVDEQLPVCLAEEGIVRGISRQMSDSLGARSLAGKKIGVLAGSRGIRNLPLIVRCIVQELQSRQAEVVVLPAMGSHGGGTAAGQAELLAHCGISEQTVGAPVLSSMQVTKIGDCAGHPVFVNSPALQLDGIVPVNRVKAHTDYHGPHESGVVKMLVIGLGKKAQAEAIHQHGTAGLRELIPLVAAKVLARVPLLFAVAIVENMQDETALVEVLGPENLFSRERELLQLSKTMLPKLPFAGLDALIVREIGKNISGVGMDPNVTGRMRINGVPDEDFAPKRIAALDLSEESQGNALGMGVADVITRRLFKKVDFSKTYVNTITSGFLERSFVPVIAESDAQAVAIAIQTCGRIVKAADARIMVIRNTLELSQAYISAALRPELPSSYIVAGKIEQAFNEQGDLILS